MNDLLIFIYFYIYSQIVAHSFSYRRTQSICRSLNQLIISINLTLEKIEWIDTVFDIILCVCVFFCHISNLSVLWGKFLVKRWGGSIWRRLIVVWSSETFLLFNALLTLLLLSKNSILFLQKREVNENSVSWINIHEECHWIKWASRFLHEIFGNCLKKGNVFWIFISSKFRFLFPFHILKIIVQFIFEHFFANSFRSHMGETWTFLTF